MPAIPGTISGGTLLRTPASLPAGDAFLLVSTTGGMSTTLLVDYQLVSEKGEADGYASLDGNGVIPVEQMPAIAITEYLGAAADQTEMLGLTGQKGDFTIRTDLSTVWVITGNDPTQLADWTQLGYPTAPVTSVAGKTGVVTLAAGDIVSGTFADARIAESNVTQHEAALTITEAQISDLQGYLLPTDIASGTITPRADDINLSGGSDGDVLTVQADGSLALEAPAGGGGAASPLTLTSGGAAEIPLTIEAHASQSGNLTQWENAAGAVRARVTSACDFSNDGGTSTTERFGLGANGGVGFSVALGPSASANSGGGTRNVAVGYSAVAYNRSVAIGWTATTTGEGAIAVGPAATAAAGQCVFGSATNPITTVYWGRGGPSSAPSSVLLSGDVAAGTNIAGGTLNIAGGHSTGSAAGGNVVLQVSLPGSSGSSANPLTNSLTISGQTGYIGYGGAVSGTYPHQFTGTVNAMGTVYVGNGATEVSAARIWTSSSSYYIQAQSGTVVQIKTWMAAETAYGGFWVGPTGTSSVVVVGGSTGIKSAGYSSANWSIEVDSSNQIGFFNAAPVAQPSGTGEATGFTAGAGTGVNDDSTFNGNVGSTAYRINDIVKALKQLGLLAQ